MLETTAFSSWRYGIRYGIVTFRGRKIKSVNREEGKREDKSICTLPTLENQFSLFFSLTATFFFLLKGWYETHPTSFSHSSFSATINVN